MEIKRKQRDSNFFSENMHNRTNYDLETGFINYISVPHLKSMAFIKVVTILCEQPDIRDQIQTFTPYDIKELPIKNVLNKLSVLPLPNLLKAKVSNVIKPIVLQLEEWNYCLHTNNIGYIDYVHWTSQGILDRAKTLEIFIQNDSVDSTYSRRFPNSIYELACTYCLEDSISYLWGKFSENVKNYYLREIAYTEYDRHLIAYWCFVNVNDMSGLYEKIKPYDPMHFYAHRNSIYESMFEVAVLRGNNLAVKYFWKKLTAEERIRYLLSFIRFAAMIVNSKIGENFSLFQTHQINKYADMLFFLLSKLHDVEQQREVILKNRAEVLQSFCVWPWQTFLLPTIRTVWDALDKEGYIGLLKKFSQRIWATDENDELDSYWSRNILNELWYESPNNLKKCFIQDLEGVSFLLYQLLAIEDMETIKEILSHANVKEKEQIICYIFFKDDRINSHTFNQVLYAGKFNVVDKLIEETSPLEYDIIRFKEKILLNEGRYLCRKWLKDNNWQIVESFLNWTFTSQDKIDYFKYNIMKEEMKSLTIKLLRRGYFELVNKCLNWCYSLEQEIFQFKREFPISSPNTVTIGVKDWTLFEKCLSWSSVSEQEIKQFKQAVLQTEIFYCDCFYFKGSIIYCSLAFHQNFEYVDKLIKWCCHSTEEIQLFKSKYVLSSLWLDILQRFVIKIQYKVWSDWKETKKLFQLFSPIKEEVKIKLKEKISELDLNYEPSSLKNYEPIKLEDLIRLLDDNTQAEFDNEVSTGNNDYNKYGMSD